MRNIWTALLAAAALTRGAAAATPGANCSRIVRVGTFDDGAPYVLAPATRWLDGGGACFAYYRQPSGARALELLGRGDLDLAFMGSMLWARAVARGVGVTAVSVLMNLDESEGLVVDSTITRLQDLRKKTLAAPYASTSHYIMLATIIEAGIDINEVTLLTASPAKIMELWDAGVIDGAVCWGACFNHLLRPHGVKAPHGHLPGRVLVDAGTVARWGYVMFNRPGRDAFREV